MRASEAERRPASQRLALVVGVLASVLLVLAGPEAIVQLGAGFLQAVADFVVAAAAAAAVEVAVVAAAVVFVVATVAAVAMLVKAELKELKLQSAVGCWLALTVRMLPQKPLPALGSSQGSKQMTAW